MLQVSTVDQNVHIVGSDECPNEAETIAVLIEFKCPFTRWPNDVIPKYYAPQLHSGLALSSQIVSVGVFVDTVFRRCSLQALGPTNIYDRKLHKEQNNPNWDTALAWGISAIYEPCPIKKDDSFTDLGECEVPLFKSVMMNATMGVYKCKHFPPCFADGRGSDLHHQEEIDTAIAELTSNPPAGHTILGIFPWKILQVRYAFIEPRDGFLEEIQPLCEEALEAIIAVRSSDNPRAALEAIKAQRMLKE